MFDTLFKLTRASGETLSSWFSEDLELGYIIKDGVGKDSEFVVGQKTRRVENQIDKFTTGFEAARDHRTLTQKCFQFRYSSMITKEAWIVE